MDLSKLNSTTIPDYYFDAIQMVHVIEHLYNGDEVIKGLLPKLKSGAYIYLKYPGEKSTRLPSMHGSLNFKDDPTHVRVYPVNELTALLEANGCIIVHAGMRRNGWFMRAMPFRIIKACVSGKNYKGIYFGMFWVLPSMCGQGRNNWQTGNGQ